MATVRSRQNIHASRACTFRHVALGDAGPRSRIPEALEVPSLRICQVGSGRGVLLKLRAHHLSAGLFRPSAALKDKPALAQIAKALAVTHLDPANGDHTG